MRSVHPMARRAKSHRGDLERRCRLGSAGPTTRDKESMVQRKPVAFRLWASVAIGAPYSSNSWPRWCGVPPVSAVGVPLGWGCC
jgi:hypothetical protein